MRNLQLTHEEISTIQNALGIAETVYSQQYQDIIKLIRVRGNEDIKPQTEKASFLFDLADKFASLNIDIKNGHKDV
jgi:hypothetical protein